MASQLSSCDPVDVYLARLGTDHSRATAASALRTAARLMGVISVDWQAVTYADLAGLRALLGRYSPAWCNTVWTIVKQVLAEARRLGLIDSALLDDVSALPRARGTGGRLGRDVDEAEIAALRQTIDSSSVLGRRDGALLALLAAGGLRCSESASIEVTDWEPTTRRLNVIHAKGRRRRVIPLPPWAADLVDDWQAVHPGTGPMLRSVDRWNNIGFALSPRSVRVALARLCDRAGVKPVSPHGLRAYRITEVLAASDPLVAMTLAGHVNLATTARYDRRGIVALDQIVCAIPMPSSRRPRLVA